MRECIRFFLNGQRVEVNGEDVFLTLSDYLRKRRGLTGTKVVCAEGDCGSCTVLVARLENGTLTYAAVTSCIQILFQLDATHVVTIEGLREGCALNPIQQAMVECQGTQCGFCTPGFVVALYELLSDGSLPEVEQLRRGLTGNLCRCTGYDSILKSALAVDRSQLKAVENLFPSAKMRAEISTALEEQVRVEAGGRRFFKPVKIADAVRFRVENPACSVISGGTDLGVVYNKRIRPINVAMSLAGIASLRSVNIDEKSIHLGGAVSLTTVKAVAEAHLPELGRFMSWFGSPLIRNAGTIGGNLVTGSPIGDTIPAMTVLGSEIELTGTRGSRTVSIDNFYTGYRQTVMAPDELLTTVRIPLLGPSQLLKLYKVSRRKDLDISSFGAAVWMQMAEGMIQQVRLAFGGVGPMVIRLPDTEAILQGKNPTLKLFEQAGAVARQEVKPISDVRGSAAYRRQLAGNVLIKFWHEVFSDQGRPASRLSLLAGQ
jgi:xanthine dehydrogenase small subunit